MTDQENWQWFRETLGRLQEASPEELPDRAELIRLWATTKDLTSLLGLILGGNFSDVHSKP